MQTIAGGKIIILIYNYVKYARIFNVRILRNKGLAKGCTK